MEKNKIPSADEFFDVILLKHGASFSTIESDKLYDDIINRAVEFAKLHVKQAAQSIYNTGLDDITTWEGNPHTGEGSDYLDLNKILNAYPEDNIK